MKRATKNGGLVILALSVDGPRLLWHITRIEGARTTATYADHREAIRDFLQG